MQQRKEPPFEKFDSFEQLFEQAERRSDYWVERAKLEFTRDILLRMEKEGVSKTELAARLEVQPGMVTRLLSGRNNFELSTMVRMAKALNCRYRSHLEPFGAQTIWIDVSNVENYSISNVHMNAEYFLPLSPTSIRSPFSEVTNHAGSDDALAENSKHWRQTHQKPFECDFSS